MHLLAERGVPLDGAIGGAVLYRSEKPFTYSDQAPIPPDAVAGSSGGVTALFMAAQVGSLELVQFFVERGARLNRMCGCAGGASTALLIAAQNGHAGIVRFLAEAGACVDTPNDFGLSPLWSAAQNGHTAVIRTLADAGADLDRAHPDGGELLRRACVLEAAGVSRTLLPPGAPIFIAAQAGHADIVTLLAARGAR